MKSEYNLFSKCYNYEPIDKGDYFKMLTNKNIVLQGLVYAILCFFIFSKPSFADESSLLVVDADVPDVEELIADLPKNTPYLLLNKQQSGFTQIANKLAKLGKINSIQIISHAKAGELLLAGETINLQSVAQHQKSLGIINAYLKKDADILFYGCDLAANKKGKKLLQYLAEKTAANVAASIDATGHEHLGANWELEYLIGQPTTALLISSKTQKTYQHVLSHFRGGIITWQATSLDNDGLKNDVEVTVKTAWYYNAASNIYFSSSPSLSLNQTSNVLSHINSDYSIRIQTFTAKNLDTNISYLIYSNSCCRIGSLKNNANGSWKIQALINLNNGNLAPKIEAPIIHDIPLLDANGATISQYVFDLSATDPNADTIRYRMATNDELGGGSNPTGLSINATTGLVSWDFNQLPSSKTGLYSAGIVVEDLDSNGNMKSKTHIDFILNLQNKRKVSFTISQNIPDSKNITIYPGSSFSFSITGTSISSTSLDNIQGKLTETTEGNFTFTPGTGTGALSPGVYPVTIEITDTTGATLKDYLFLNFIVPDVSAPIINNLEGDTSSYLSILPQLVDTNMNAVVVYQDDNGNALLNNGLLRFNTTRHDGQNEILGIHSVGDTTGSIRRTNSEIFYEGTKIADIDTTENGVDQPLTMRLGSSVSVAAVQALVRSLTYTNQLTIRTVGQRDLSLSIQDAGGLNSIYTFSIDVKNNRLSMNEDATYSFAETDFGGKKIKITQLPNVGDLYLDTNSDGVIDSGETVTLNQEIEVIDISKLKFKPVANANGSSYASFQFQIYEDNAYNVTAYTITIDVTAVNDAPINSIPSTQTTDEDTPLIFSIDNSNQISISDIEAEDAVGNSITVTLTATNGTLTLSSTTNLTFDGTDDAGMEFSGIVTDINTALEDMTFTPTSNYNGNASVDIVINDGALTDTDTINITVNPVNDIPSFTKGADQTVNEDSGAQTIANWATNISAGPSNEYSQTLNFTVTNNNNSLFKVQPTIDSTGNLSFTSAANATGIAIVSVKIFDGIDTSAAQNFNITILDVNDEPINTVPTVQTVNEGSTLIFSTENSNQIAITDSDAGTNSIKVKLTTTNGTLTLSGNNGLAFVTGTGTNDAEMVFTGTVTDINTALEDMSFTPIAEFYGNATIQIEANDQSLTDTDTINITVNPVNDIPSFTKGADQTVYTNSGTQTIPNWATNISAGPSNESSQTLNFTVTNDNNSLFAVQPTIDANGNLSFTPAAAGSAVITVVLSDGIDKSAAQTFNIKVNPLPASAPTQQTTSEPTGSSVGTNINCIKNEGTITDAKIEPECSIEGGTLEGEIKNEGTIKNVTLAAGTKIEGGQIQGKISGNPEAPAVLQHLTVEPKTKLTAVIISDGVDLTQALPSIIPDSAEIQQPSPVDLSNDPIVNGLGLITKINLLPVISASGKIEQNSNTGFLTLKIEAQFFAVIPMKVRYIKTKTRASTEQAVRLGIGQRIYFTTEDGMEIMANPAVQDLKLLKTALAKLNLPTFNITEEGNIKIPATETTWYSARPYLASTTVDKDTPKGFITKEDGNVALIFEDEKGEKREQIFYPCPADMSALEKFDLTPNGILEFQINGQKFKGRLDYKVEQGKPTPEGIKVTEIPDSNGYFMITYPDGAEQRLFALPE